MHQVMILSQRQQVDVSNRVGSVSVAGATDHKAALDELKRLAAGMGANAIMNLCHFRLVASPDADAAKVCARGMAVRV